MNISPADIATLEKLTEQDGARGAIARVLLEMIPKPVDEESDTELLGDAV